MNSHVYFWSNFEEVVGDAGLAALSGPTKTGTATREEDDQDKEMCSSATFPRGTSPSRTKTVTETREELDQDEPCARLSSIPRSSQAYKTVTFTRAREEDDQDERCVGAASMPRE